jgi:hypothetical protein
MFDYDRERLILALEMNTGERAFLTLFGYVHPYVFQLNFAFVSDRKSNDRNYCPDGVARA